jgi:hypothetical protein
MLGLIEPPPTLGDLDEDWRMIHDVDFPVADDPRADE